MEHLHTSLIPTLEGQLINWKAPIYRANQGFYGYGLTGGYATVIDGKLTTIAGDSIESSFVSYDGLMAFSDSDRMVAFEIVELKQSIESLISERNAILNETKSMIEKAEDQTHYNEIGKYENCPKGSQFKTKKEYTDASLQYQLNLEKAYAAFSPIETAARKIIADFDEKVRHTYEKPTSYIIKHSTKGYYSGTGYGWISINANIQHAKTFTSIAAAIEIGKTLTSLDGSLIKGFKVVSWKKNSIGLSFRLWAKVYTDNDSIEYYNGVAQLL